MGLNSMMGGFRGSNSSRSIPNEHIKLIELDINLSLVEFEDYQKIQEAFGDWWDSMSDEEKKFIVSIITILPSKRKTPPTRKETIKTTEKTKKTPKKTKKTPKKKKSKIIQLFKGNLFGRGVKR